MLEVLSSDQIANETEVAASRPTVFELLAQPLLHDTVAYPQESPSLLATQRPSQRPTHIGGVFMGIDHDVDPD